MIYKDLKVLSRFVWVSIFNLIKDLGAMSIRVKKN